MFFFDVMFALFCVVVGFLMMKYLFSSASIAPIHSSPISSPNGKKYGRVLSPSVRGDGKNGRDKLQKPSPRSPDSNNNDDNDNKMKKRDKKRQEEEASIEKLILEDLRKANVGLTSDNADLSQQKLIKRNNKNGNEGLPSKRNNGENSNGGAPRATSNKAIDINTFNNVTSDGFTLVRSENNKKARSIGRGNNDSERNGDGYNREKFDSANQMGALLRAFFKKESSKNNKANSGRRERSNNNNNKGNNDNKTSPTDRNTVRKGTESAAVSIVNGNTKKRIWENNSQS